ncbi:MAG: hypothetical protein V4666_01865 [Bacteroidota bacterium]
MRKLKFLISILLLVNYSFSQGNIIKVSGTVTADGIAALAEVKVSVLGGKNQTFTNKKGKYKINTIEGDVLVFSYPEKENTTITIGPNSKIVNITLRKKEDIQRIILKKPVIYLYPKEKTDIEISLNFEGKILTTFPKLEKSWKVTGYENGQIFDKKTNRFYNSLFWDGEITFPTSHYQYKTGFVVEKENLTSFLIEKLEHMGLNTAESNDFIQYWLPILEKNNYTFIHFLANEDYSIFSTNNVTPKPDTSIRIFMEFFKVDKQILIAPQELPSTKRNGFTLVEWGGSDVSNMKPLDNLMIN